MSWIGLSTRVNCTPRKFNWLGFVLHSSALKKVGEYKITMPGTYERQWNAEFKDGTTKKKERVVAYLIGSGSPMPYSGNPCIRAVEEMATSTPRKSDKVKYVNTIAFLSHSYGPDPIAAILNHKAG